MLTCVVSAAFGASLRGAVLGVGRLPRATTGTADSMFPNEEPPLPGVQPREEPGAPGLIGVFLITRPVLRSGLPHAHLRRESCVQSRLTCVVSAAFGASLRGAALGVGRLPRATTGPAGNMFPQ